MRNVFAANRMRLRKSRALWICMGLVFLFTVYMVLTGYNSSLRYGSEMGLEDSLFGVLPFGGLVLSAFFALFLGTEFGDGTVRNKIIAGRSRVEIYLANLLTCFLGCTAIFLAWTLAGFVGLPLFGLWKIGTKAFLVKMAVDYFSVLSLTALLVPVCHMISNKATCAVVSIFTDFGILLAGSYFYNSLCEPETMQEFISFSQEEGAVYGDLIPNPAYIGGSLRTVYQWMLNLLPSGQQIWVADEPVTEPVKMCLCSLAVIAAATAIGLALFRRKELK